MKIYRLTSLRKMSTVNFYVKGLEINKTLDSVYNISVKLNSLLHGRWMDANDRAYFSEFNNVPKSDTITIDGYDVDSPTGTINFYIEGIKPERVDIYLQKISMYFDTNGIKYGEFRREQSRMYDVPVIRIPIIGNQVGKDALKDDRPPEINLSNNNAIFIFRDVLGFDNDSWENNLLNAQDLKNRIEYFEGETNLPEGSHAGQGAINMSLEEALGSLQTGMSSYDETKVREVLGRIKAFCDWVMKHGYNEIYIA